MAGRIVTTNAGSLALRYQKRAQALTPALLAAERRNIEQARTLAVKNSSGRFYRGGGIRVGGGRFVGGRVIYPYSIRTPAPPGPPHIANVQTGRLRSGWKTQVQTSASGITSTLRNDTPYARYFDGNPTRHMIARPLLQDVTRQIQPVRLQRLAAAQTAALRAGGTGTAPMTPGGATGGSSGGGSAGSIGLGIVLGAFIGAFNGVTGG